MKVHSKMAKCHMEPQDQELVTVCDMRPESHASGRLLQVLFCIVPVSSRSAAAVPCHRRGEKTDAAGCLE